MVYGLSSESVPDDLRPLFTGADEIVVAKDTMTKFPYVGKRKEHAAIARGDDG